MDLDAKRESPIRRLTGGAWADSTVPSDGPVLWSPDGTRIVESEKARTLDPQTCVSHTQMVNGVPQVMTYCSQGDR